MTTAYWSPNQTAQAQVETYTFTAPSSVGNTYSATINGKSVTYDSVSGDTAATAATALYALVSASTGVPPEINEIIWANPSDGVLTATAQTPGTPFANVTVGGVSGQGLVLSTGNGLVNGITTTHTKANKSPSDVGDAQNWLRVTTPAPGVRQLPQNGDDVVIGDSGVSMLWNADHLANVTFATLTRLSTMTGSIGLPLTNSGGYTEWRAPYFKFLGPAGSVPSGGLSIIVGQGGTSGGPAYEHYDVGSQKVTLTIVSGRIVRFLGVHTDNTFTVLGGAVLYVAAGAGEIATLSSCTVDGNSGAVIGSGVTWTSGATLTVIGGEVRLSAAPGTLDLRNDSTATIVVHGLTWATISMQNGCTLNWLAGGIITTLTMFQRCVLDKSADARALTITNSTIDGNDCQFVDPLSAITWTNATSVQQQVTQGPFVITGTRTIKVT